MVDTSKTSGLKVVRVYHGRETINTLVPLALGIMSSDAQDAKSICAKAAELMEAVSETMASHDGKLSVQYADAANTIRSAIDLDGNRRFPFSILTTDEYFGVSSIKYLEERGEYDLALDKLIFNMVNGIMIEKRVHGYREGARDAISLFRLKAEATKMQDTKHSHADSKFADYIEMQLGAAEPRLETGVASVPRLG